MKPFLYLLSLTLVRRDRFGDLPDRGSTVNAKRLSIARTGSDQRFEICMRVGNVCRAFDTTRRRAVLSFEHHKTLAALKLKPEIVDSLLDWCEAPDVTRSAQLDKAARRGICTPSERRLKQPPNRFELTD